ncbi:MAG: YceI family protein [Vulcanimicrobiaceae bacterium]
MSTAIQTKTYVIDPKHSSVHFAVRHLVISKVRGQFRTLSGKVELADSAIPVSVFAEIDAASIDTREEQRDGHLRSEDFLHVEAYPTLIFKSTQVVAKSDTAFTLTGDLTLHGVTRTVSLDAEVEGRTVDPWGNDRIGYGAEGKLSRKDFGLAWNQLLESGGAIVGDTVEIILSLEVVPAA